MEDKTLEAYMRSVFLSGERIGANAMKNRILLHINYRIERLEKAYQLGDGKFDEEFLDGVTALKELVKDLEEIQWED